LIASGEAVGARPEDLIRRRILPEEQQPDVQRGGVPQRRKRARFVQRRLREIDAAPQCELEHDRGIEQRRFAAPALRL
jgi:hypothetical protein